MEDEESTRAEVPIRRRPAPATAEPARFRHPVLLLAGLLFAAGASPAQLAEPDVAADPQGNLLAVAVAQIPQGREIVAQPIDSSCKALGDPIIVSPTAVSPAVAFLGEDEGRARFVVVWAGEITLVGRRGIWSNVVTVDFDQGAVEVEDPERQGAAPGSVVTTSPTVAANGAGVFAVAWERSRRDLKIVGSLNDGGSRAPFTAAVGGALPRLAMAPAGASPAAESLAVAWQQDGDIRAATLFRTPNASETVNLFRSGEQRFPSIAAAGEASDDFVVLWESSGPGGDAGIFGRRFPTSIEGPELQVNTRILGDQTRPDAAADRRGNFLVAWLDEGSEPPRIAGQRFSRTGLYVEDELDLSADACGGADGGRPSGRPRVAALPGGAFAVTWVAATPAGEDTLRWNILEPSDAYLECIAEGSTLCPADGRFRVRVAWRTGDGRRGSGRAVPLSDESGYFWFFDPENVELVVKILPACERDDPCFWVFAGGLTDLGVEITVTDTLSGQREIYANPLGVPFQPILDTWSFRSAGASPADDPNPSALRLRRRRPGAIYPKAGGGGCGGAEGAICLRRDRFRLEVTWTTPQGHRGAGRGVKLTRDSGYFWFFDRSNIEVFFKVLDGCGFNGRYWVFGAGLTDVGVEVRVTDTVSGEVWTHANPLGAAFQPVLDASAFATCPAPARADPSGTFHSGVNR